MLAEDWLLRRSQLTPGQTAIRDADCKTAWSFRQLNERAEALAGIFIKKGIQQGDRVALLAPNHISYFDFFFACWKIGAIFVPLNWRLAKKELTYIMAHCSPKLMGIHESVTYGPEDFLIPVMPIDNTYEEALEKGKNPILKPAANDGPVMIIYTGGTTGHPKGVLLTKKNINANAINTIISWELTKEDVTLTSIPLFHTGGFNSLTMPILMAGGTVVYTGQFNEENACRYLNEYGCTIVLFVPTMYQMITNCDYFKKHDFPTMRCFLSGGAPCPKTIYESFAEKSIPFKEGYGLSEAGPNNFFIDPAVAIRKKGSVGKPMLFNSVKLFNEHTEVNKEEVGELLIRGDHVFSEYWQDKNVTEQTMLDGWLRTGDLARMDEDGDFYIVGRKKDMIITGGENVYPAEIENVLIAHPDITEAAVAGIKDEKWGEAVTAFVVSQSSHLDEEQLQQYCRSCLANYKVPKTILFLENLPKTDVGKLDKKALLSIRKGGNLKKV